MSVTWQVRLGCAHLEEALALLEEARLSNGSSKLTSEIHEGLRQLKPDCVIEHLKVHLSLKIHLPDLKDKLALRRS